MDNREFNKDMNRLRNKWLAYVTCPIAQTLESQRKLASYQKLLTELSGKYHMDLPDLRLSAGI